MDGYDFGLLNITIRDHVAVVHLANPPVNALNRQMQDELAMAFDLLSDDGQVRAVILTGEGKLFCAGADIKARADTAAIKGGPRGHLRSARECFHAIVECKKPVVAAINGPALGAGLAIVASCDILLASEQTSLGIPEIDVGLMGGGRHAMRLFGHSRLRRMAVTGYRVPGQELYRLGVVEACVPLAELMPMAITLAKDIALESAPCG